MRFPKSLEVEQPVFLDRNRYIKSSSVSFMRQASEAVGQDFNVFGAHIAFVSDGGINGVAQLLRGQRGCGLLQHIRRHNMRLDAHGRRCFFALKEHRSHQHKKANEYGDQANTAKDVTPNSKVAFKFLDHGDEFFQVAHFIQSLFSWGG